MARNERGSDATAARKLARSEPMSGRNTRSDETPRLSHIGRLKPGDDPTAAINRLYSEGRRTYGQPNPDQPRERTPKFKGIAPDESQLQFDDKASNLNDTREAWCRGMGGQSPHPKFDSGPSGNRYSRK
jgi:hypothetical protein